MAGNVFGCIFYYVSTIFAKSYEKSHRLWIKNQSLARGLLALQIKIPLGIHLLGPWEGGIWSRFFLITLTSPPGQSKAHPACHTDMDTLYNYSTLLYYSTVHHTTQVVGRMCLICRV